MVKISQSQTSVRSIQGGVLLSRVNTNPDDDDDDDDCSSCNTALEGFTNFIDGDVFIPETASLYSLCCYDHCLYGLQLGSTSNRFV